MKKARTKNGEPARIYSEDGCEPYIYHGAYLSYDGWESCSWMKNGRYFHNPSGLDLDLNSIEQ